MQRLIIDLLVLNVCTRMQTVRRYDHDHDGIVDTIVPPVEGGSSRISI